MNSTYLTDSHLHTYFSSDSNTSPVSMVKRAIELGLHGLCFTDHNDLEYPENEDGMTFHLDLKSYYSELMQLKEEYHNILPIYIGLEQGLQSHLADQINQYANEYAFDFIIGSSHLLEGKDLYYKENWEGTSIKEVISKYYVDIIKNIQTCDKFHVYGHLDYIIRYIPDSSFSYELGDYMDIIEEALKLLIQKGKGIEINTSGFKYELGQAHPDIKILKLYRQLGGEILTIGSDAHKPEHLGYSFNQVPHILKECGYKYYTQFISGKPNFIKL